MTRHRAWGPVVEAALRAAHNAVRRLDPGVGQRVVGGRAAGYRTWDPDVIGVDTAAERAAIRALRAHGVHGVLLSEEAGETPLAPRRGRPARGEPVHVVMDPFDGSMLYRRGLRVLWYTALGVYGAGGAARAAGVIEHVTGEVVLVDAAGVRRRSRLGARPRPVRPAATARLDGAFVEAYLMKPAFLYPTATALRPLFERAAFVFGNGGPGGFADVACGRIDVYLCWQEALTEVFSAVAIAERAGCVVTRWDGAPLRFQPDIHALHSLVCSANPRLHADVLQALRGVTPPKGFAP